MSKPLEIAEIANVLSITAGELGFPRGKYPTHINLRNDSGQRYRFTFDGIEDLGGIKTAVYAADEEMRLLVALHWAER